MDDVLKQQCLDLIYESLILSVDYNIFMNFFKDWEILPIYSKKTLAGGFLLKDNEIHIGISTPFQKKIYWRKYFKLYIKPLLEIKGYLRTSLLKIDLSALSILLKAGLTVISEDENLYYLRLDKLNYV